MAVEATGVAKVAGLLFGYGLLLRKRLIDLLHDLLRVLEGEAVSVCPADRRGVCKGGPSIIGPVNIVPDPHGPLPEVCTHDAGAELLHLVGMAVGLAAGLPCNGRIVSKCLLVPVVIQKRTHVVIKRSVRRPRQHLTQPVIAGRHESFNVAFSWHAIEIIVEHHELQHALVGSGRVL